MATDKSLTKADIDFLDDFLVSDNAPENCLMVSGIDGFFAALHCGPEAIMPNEWLPVIWDGEEPEYDDLAQAEKVMSILMCMYNKTGNVLNSGKPFEPLLFERHNPDGKNYIICDSWCYGFYKGMQLWKPDWDKLMDDGLYKLLSPILIVGHPEHSEHFHKQINVEGLKVQLPDKLPELVMGVFEQCINALCPCGSGRKYKKCCGEQTIH